MDFRAVCLSIVLTALTLTTEVIGQLKADQSVIEPYVLNGDTLLYLQAVHVTITNQVTKTSVVVKLVDEAMVSATGQKQNITVDVKYAKVSGESESAVEDFVLHLRFDKVGGYWTLKEATMDGKITLSGVSVLKDEAKPKQLVTRMELAAPFKMSYHCGRYGPLSVKLTADDLKHRPNATVAIELIDFQFQPGILSAKKGEGLKFGRSYDCVGFFSIGILSGWFVALILLGLLSWGIKMISNVHTMDRFDDPKGKTITVNATD